MGEFIHLAQFQGERLQAVDGAPLAQLVVAQQKGNDGIAPALGRHYGCIGILRGDSKNRFFASSGRIGRASGFNDGDIVDRREDFVGDIGRAEIRNRDGLRGAGQPCARQDGPHADAVVGDDRAELDFGAARGIRGGARYLDAFALSAEHDCIAHNGVDGAADGDTGLGRAVDNAAVYHGVDRSLHDDRGLGHEAAAREGQTFQRDAGNAIVDHAAGDRNGSIAAAVDHHIEGPAKGKASGIGVAVFIGHAPQQHFIKTVARQHGGVCFLIGRAARKAGDPDFGRAGALVRGLQRFINGSKNLEGAGIECVLFFRGEAGVFRVIDHENVWLKLRRCRAGEQGKGGDGGQKRAPCGGVRALHAADCSVMW